MILMWNYDQENLTNERRQLQRILKNICQKIAKKCWFLAENAEINKIKGVLVLKDMFPETKYVCTDVRSFSFLA